MAGVLRMMECSQAHWLIQEYLENHLDELKTAQLAGHLLECATCRGELSEMERAFVLFEAQPVLQPPQRVQTNILAELSQFPEEPRFFSRSESRRVIWKSALSWIFGASGIGLFMILLWIGHPYFLRFLPTPRAISFLGILNWFLSALRSVSSFLGQMFHAIWELFNFSPAWESGFFAGSSARILFGIALLAAFMALLNKRLLRHEKR
jgi:hypothetical protein